MKLIEELRKVRKQYYQKQKNFSELEIKELTEKYFYYLENKKEAEEYFKKDWKYISLKARLLGITSIKINKNCAQFLGCHVAERVLSHVFKDVKRMSINNTGYDFICNKGFKIEVKSSTLPKKNNQYVFQKLHNKLADYFIFIGFDNRENLNPQHIWLINSDEVITNYRNVSKKLCKHEMLSISNTINSLSKFSKYELTDKLKETIECCNVLKGNESKEGV